VRVRHRFDSCVAQGMPRNALVAVAPASPMRALLVVLLFLLAGCAGNVSTDETSLNAAELPSSGAPQAVVMVQDNGFNPYHIGFRDDSPRAYQHPSTYLPGYPSDAIALPITLDADDYESALTADCELWKNVTNHQQYWFPGTKLISAISFDTGEPVVDCAVPRVGFLGASHGTMTTSRATSYEYGACKRCLVGIVVGFTTEGVWWIGEQEAWVDVQSHSWGPVAPIFLPVDESGASPIVSDPEFNNAVETGAQRVMSFWASGNGAATRGGVLGHPTFLTPHFGPSVVIVGGHDSGYINTWPGFTPHIISDSCNSWAAYHDSLDGSDDSVGGGTSGATPFAAGIAADILLEARMLLGDLNQTGRNGDLVANGTALGVTTGPLADGTFTWQEWRDVLYKTATSRPERQYEDGSVCTAGAGLGIYDSTPVQWKQIPDDVPAYPYVGYGAADNASRELAFEVLRGENRLPVRDDEDAYFVVYEELRRLENSIARGEVPI
jgi:hypothetical protein